MRTCTNNACGLSFAPAGTPVTMQTPNDCQLNQCDGMGVEITGNDDTDVPVDGNDCTDDVCTSGVPSNPPSPVGTMCSTGVCDGTGSCVVSVVSGVDYVVIAQGGQLVITGAGFTGAVSVTIGGVTQTFVVDSDTQITIASVSGTTPLAAQDVVVTTGAGSSAPFQVTVIRLQINELDCDQTSTDTMEFVELSTGVPNVDLTGYTLVFWNGSNNQLYQPTFPDTAIDLNATADTNGLLLVGNAMVIPTPALITPDNSLQNGADAVGVYQGTMADFPAMTPVTAAGLIDALVYGTSDPDATVLLSTLMLNPIQVDENVNASSTTDSIRRCADGLRDGSLFTVGTPPTPGAANSCP